MEREVESSFGDVWGRAIMSYTTRTMGPGAVPAEKETRGATSTRSGDSKVRPSSHEAPV